MIYYSTTVTAIGEEVPDLLDGGVLILYEDGAPAALAEVSVQHRVSGMVASVAPPVGAQITLGTLTTRVSAVGSSAWNKVRELGHVVFNFNGAVLAERPGEICVEPLDLSALRQQMRSGSPIVIAD
ncbi:PTS glucitol/sorbitol transporter subunit IIA [Sphaerotilus sp.]|uniref:PTS glucitol/sorbitol transporter subunit IIA n=1 Tax=Sphaerotilus sp. TaxID=2093942 RepID=UPI0034E1B544